jgi:hypothetical protein
VVGAIGGWPAGTTSSGTVTSVVRDERNELAIFCMEGDGDREGRGDARKEEATAARSRGVQGLGRSVWRAAS